MEQQLAAGMGEGQISEFVEDHEVDPGQVIRDTTHRRYDAELKIAVGRRA